MRDASVFVVGSSGFSATSPISRRPPRACARSPVETVRQRGSEVLPVRCRGTHPHPPADIATADDTRLAHATRAGLAPRPLPPRTNVPHRCTERWVGLVADIRRWEVAPP